MALDIHGKVLRDKDGEPLRDELFLNDPLDSTLDQYEKNAEIDELVAEIEKRCNE